MPTGEFPLRCNVWSRAGGVLFPAPKLTDVPCNWIPIGAERGRNLAILQAAQFGAGPHFLAGRFLFAKGTDVEDGGGDPPSFDWAPNADLIECPVGSISIINWGVIWVEDSFPGTITAWRQAWVWRHYAGGPGVFIPPMAP